ncbi:MAG: hypothetical protein HXY41_08225 [Chloroflexi bacterium]|nr:hypothetical protein [Chloroflexota bacterium]
MPTLMPTGLPVEMPTEAPAATLPPTEPPVQRPTLPPTWTPSPAPVEAATLPPTEPPAVDNPNAGLPPSQATLPACATFREDRSRYSTSFRLGSEAAVAWIAAETAASYRVNLIDEFGTELFAGYTTETTFLFAADLFERGKRYGWNVYPMDAMGQQMCISVGGELFPQ